MALAADMYLAKNPEYQDDVELVGIAARGFSLGALTFLCPEGTCSPSTDPVEVEEMRATFKSKGL